MADNTKEKILKTALRLFAADGYEAVSVSMIAGELKITKGALYKHYKNKRDIFDSIVERMYQIDAERSRRYEVPQESFEKAEEEYENVAWKNVRQFTAAQFDFWTGDGFAVSFRRMLTLEQYRNDEMARLYRDCIVQGPVEYMKNIFCKMIAEGTLKNADPFLLAVEFYSPLFLLIAMSDFSADKKQYASCIDSHIERFIVRNRAKPKGEADE